MVFVSPCATWVKFGIGGRGLGQQHSSPPQKVRSALVKVKRESENFHVLSNRKQALRTLWHRIFNFQSLFGAQNPWEFGAVGAEEQDTFRRGMFVCKCVFGAYLGSMCPLPLLRGLVGDGLGGWMGLHQNDLYHRFMISSLVLSSRRKVVGNFRESCMCPGFISLCTFACKFTATRTTGMAYIHANVIQRNSCI